MTYSQFVEEHGLKGKRTQVFKSQGKSAYTRVGDLVIIFAGTKDSEWNPKFRPTGDTQVSQLSENVYIIGGQNPVGTYTF